MIVLWANKIIFYTKPIIPIFLLVLLVTSYFPPYVVVSIKLPDNVVIPAVLVFGDSIVDPGNNNFLPTIAKANFPPYGRDFPGGSVPTGRFSNGKVPSDFIVEEFGIKELVPPYLDPTLQISDLLTGVSFATGASGYDPESSKLANVPNLEDQLELFKGYINKVRAAVGENRTQFIISQSLYVLCTGSNDITNTYFGLPFKRLQYSVSSYTSMMAKQASTFLQGLHSLGARTIGVVSTPPCGCLPSQRTVRGGLIRNCVDYENQASILFNDNLNSELNSLTQKYPASKFVYLDIYNILLNLITNPSQYGFEVANRGCCGTGKIEASILCTKLDVGTCKNASKYVFWDSYHPTEAAYKILIQDVVQKNINKLF